MTEAAGVARWLADLEARHLRDLTPTEVARALRALSSVYVERRSRLTTRGAFDTAGKRAAYALYYGPRRYDLVHSALQELASSSRWQTVFDLGCGSGAAGAAVATLSTPPARVVAVDRHPWAVEETKAALAAFGVSARVHLGGIEAAFGPSSSRHAIANEARAGDVLVLSYVVNELDDAARARLLPGLLDIAARGARVLVLEPIARGTTPWWTAWAAAFVGRGGRADEWKRPAALPSVTIALGHAAGLDVRVSSGRTLWM